MWAALVVLEECVEAELQHIPELQAALSLRYQSETLKTLKSDDDRADVGVTGRHNLPRREYLDFIGRDREMASLLEKLSPQDRTWLVVIDGIGGVGPSTP
jgi:hypothetical protein